MVKSKKFNRSQKAHSRLLYSYAHKEDTAKNRALAYYHGDCLDKQKERGRILPKSERKKLFSFWWNFEVENKHTKYPF